MAWSESSLICRDQFAVCCIPYCSNFAIKKGTVIIIVFERKESIIFVPWTSYRVRKFTTSKKFLIDRRGEEETSAYSLPNLLLWSSYVYFYYKVSHRPWLGSTLPTSNLLSTSLSSKQAGRRSRYSMWTQAGCVVSTDFLQEVFGPLLHHSDGKGSLSAMVFDIGFGNLFHIPESKTLWGLKTITASGCLSHSRNQDFRLHNAGKQHLSLQAPTFPNLFQGSLASLT